MADGGPADSHRSSLPPMSCLVDGRQSSTRLLASQMADDSLAKARLSRLSRFADGRSAVAGAATGVAVAGAAAVAASAADESSEDKSNCGIEIDVGAAVELIVACFCSGE
nr:hypothetical protein Iba_chr14aCG12290 [Ipomoea batatas]